MKKKVALVLSSGGARGMAHIGVIEALLANNFEISSISGSSVGAVVGAFQAAGHLPTYKDWVMKLDKVDVFKLIDFTFSVQGFIRGEKVFKTLQEIIPDQKIEHFPIPFSATATDLRMKEEVVLTSGWMYEVIRASSAIPTVIKPQKIGSRELIDGGVTNPIPVNHVKRQENDLLVVVNVNASIPNSRKIKADKTKNSESSLGYLQKMEAFRSQWSSLLPSANTRSEEKLGYFDLLNRSIDLMQDKLTQLILDQYKPDLCLDISRDTCSTFEFYKAGELIDIGRDLAEKSIINLKNVHG